MYSSSEISNAIRALKSALKMKESNNELSNILKARDEVLIRYQSMFSIDGINNLTEEDFRDFLMLRNNKHWSGLQRMGPGMTESMPILKKALIELVDENVPIVERLNNLLPNGKARVKHLGKAILTPILLIKYPEVYGVWNGTSEGAMRELKIWPNFDRGLPIGNRYTIINELLLQISNKMSIDLWTLDALWWMTLKMVDEEIYKENGDNLIEEDNTQQFGLERHLQDFLFDNWEKTILGKQWDLVEEGGDIKGYGYERPTDVGRIDLLAIHKKEPRWMVIELKRGQTSDSTVGQVLRYMGWIKQNLAEKGQEVEGLIIALNDTEKLRYAREMTSNIRFMSYNVEFNLIEE